MKIKDITYADTGKTRTDGRYPLRIGSEVNFYYPLTVGDSMVLSYVSDNQGNPKSGYLTTSTVLGIEESDEETVVETRNSIYYFEKTSSDKHYTAYDMIKDIAKHWDEL